MQRRRLGNRGAEVSRLALGTMTWSRDTSREEAGRLLGAFADAGGSLIDTAATYADGGSESVIGSLLAGGFARSEFQICTKAGVRRTPEGGVIDASRGALLDTLDASLKRLETDHVDLWLVHTFDPVTPLEETMHALEVALTTGRARQVGVSNFPGWALARAASVARDAAAPAAAQMEYSLLERGIEREVVPAAQSLGMGILAWSPLGRGVLTGKYAHAIPADSRAASDHLAGFVEPYLTPRAASVVTALMTAADGLGRSAHEVALAWVRDAPGVASAIVGARTAEQLAPSLAAEDLVLPEPIRTALDDVTSPTFGYPERR
ncbi:aldo/keto reductase [Demequina sp. TTPB684]|uniref:aldo/keto reductase n=1 Tax=unclassified Demequina TaxID=2620311 RepID=UPI001CF3DF01|nr:MULTISPECIES: aldo/keto reductase [unclassified Demequina]MCB2413915.1 aldo/keto reductase [Demequina sp. TTPB684]UPU89397.1 aldo/keto reductase [Demequina sp. TMPB413]